MKRLLLCLALLAQPAIAQAGSLDGSEWQPEGNPKAFVRFEAEGAVVGHGGCNGFFSKVAVKGAVLEFGPIGSTRKMCPADVMEKEGAFLKALENARAFRREGPRLALYGRTGKVLLKLRQTDWD